jgi:shikimate 5-dehydrogenase
MFMEQAVRQFEIWTDQSAPRAAMEKAAIEALENESLKSEESKLRAAK